MRAIVLILALLVSTLSGCGVDWFPSASVAGFSFSPAALTGVDAGSTQTSNTVTLSIAGTSTMAISVSGDSSSQYKVNDGAFTKSAATVKNGDLVTVQHTAATTANATVTTTLTVGSKSATFSSTTAASTVQAFSFAPATFRNVSSGILKASNPVTITIVGTAARLNVSGSATSKYKINAGSFVNVSGATVVNGDKVSVQHDTGTASATKVVTTLTIGNKFANFSTVTR